MGNRGISSAQELFEQGGTFLLEQVASLLRQRDLRFTSQQLHPGGRDGGHL